MKVSNLLPKIGDGFELYASYSDYAKYMEQQKLRIILAYFVFLLQKII